MKKSEKKMGILASNESDHADYRITIKTSYWCTYAHIHTYMYMEGGNVEQIKRL